MPTAMAAFVAHRFLDPFSRFLFPLGETEFGREKNTEKIRIEKPGRLIVKGSKSLRRFAPPILVVP